MRLVDRCVEKKALDALLDSVRAGMSAALVLRGEPGIGKSALLDYAVERAADLQIVRTVAVESEKTLGFAAVHQLLVPLLPVMDRLPEPQRQALGVAFGLVSGPPANPFLVGLAVLTLLSDAAEVRPVLWVMDDAQWLDEESADALSFVARRLLADRVGMLFAIRETTEPDVRLHALPDLRLAGLPAPDAYKLLQVSISRPIDAAVAECIVAATGGNPLAVVEAARELTPEQLDGRAPLPEPLAVGHRLDDLFVRRVRDLPPDTQACCCWRRRTSRAGALGCGRPRPRWPSRSPPRCPRRPPDWWSSGRRCGSSTRWSGQRSTTRRHRVSGGGLTVSSPPPATRLDPDGRAWHLAAAAAGPDERVAAEQEAAAERAGNRGGYAAAGALLERAALLTPDRGRRAQRRLSAAEAHLLAGAIDRAGAQLAEAGAGLIDPCSSARATRLEGRIQFARGHVSEAVSMLVDAARRLRPLDPGAARDALLSALEAAMFAGWASCDALLQDIAGIARDLPPTGDLDPPDSAANLLLKGYTTRVTRGYVAAVPALRRAVQAFLAEDVNPDVALRRLELAAISAIDLMDDASAEWLTASWIHRARQHGALAKLAAALAYRSAYVDGPAGRLGEARAAESEAHDLAEATHNPAAIPPTGAHTLLTLALSGREAEARATAAAVSREAPGRGAAGEMAMAAHFLGVLEISLGNYSSAVRSLGLAYTDDTPLVGTRALPDLVEAAARTGQPDLAERALRRLDDRATATGTALALGLLARSRALLAAPAEAGQQYEDALHLLGRTRAAPQLARAHLLYGEWLRRQRRRGAAREHLRTAHDMFDAMGLEAFAGRAGAELRATGEHARKREAGFPEELTPQEAQIAALVSRGEANRDIAAQLFLSPSTVEYHLRKVFRKLGVTSRTQLTRRVVEDDADLDGGTAVPQHPGRDRTH